MSGFTVKEECGKCSLQQRSGPFSIPPPEGLRVRPTLLRRANPISHAGALWASSTAALLYSAAPRQGSPLLAVSGVLPEEKQVSVVITQRNGANLVLPFKHT